MEETVNFSGKTYNVIIFNLGNIPLIVAKAKNGYVTNSYIDPKAAEKVGDVAAFVAGVKTVDDLLKAKIRNATPWAEDLGVREGMSVKKALEIMGEG